MLVNDVLRLIKRFSDDNLLSPSCRSTLPDALNSPLLLSRVTADDVSTVFAWFITTLPSAVYIPPEYDSVSAVIFVEGPSAKDDCTARQNEQINTKMDLCHLLICSSIRQSAGHQSAGKKCTSLAYQI